MSDAYQLSGMVADDGVFSGRIGFDVSPFDLHQATVETHYDFLVQKLRDQAAALGYRVRKVHAIEAEQRADGAVYAVSALVDLVVVGAGEVIDADYVDITPASELPTAPRLLTDNRGKGKK